MTELFIDSAKDTYKYKEILFLNNDKLSTKIKKAKAKGSGEFNIYLPSTKGNLLRELKKHSSLSMNLGFKLPWLKP